MSISSPSITHLISLTGRTAILTGGAMVIGRGIVERLAEAGASVVVADADLEAFRAHVPMRRIGAPDDIGIARTALFLASDVASCTTGTQVVVDGGRLLA